MDAIGFEPTDAQIPIHQSDARFLLIGGGWRSGKSTPTAMEAAASWHKWKLCYIVGAQYENAIAEFDIMSDFFMLLERKTKSKIIVRRQRPASGQSRCSLTLRYQDSVKRVITISAMKGAHTLTRRGEPPDLVLLVEMEALGYDIWLAARGRVAEKRGRIIVSGKFPDDVGWQAELYRRWQGENAEDGASFSLPTWSNTAIFEGREDPEIKSIEATVPPHEFLRDYGGEPQKPATLVFPGFTYKTHVFNWVEFEPKIPVELWIDPGYGESAYAVLAVHIAGSMACVFDEVYLHGHTGEEIIKICDDKDWRSKVTGGVIDIAGRQHHATESQQEVWQEAGVYLRSSRVTLEEGRDRLKNFLMVDPLSSLPRIVFHPRCKQTIAEFGKYQWKRGPEERVSGEKPVDKHCDSIKAMTYGLIDRFGVVDWQKPYTPYVQPREALWNKLFGIK